jgi:hypothetical protein
MTIPKAIAYSPHTTLSSGCDTTAATEMEVTSLAAFPDLDAGEIGIVVLCSEEDFRSTDAADFETLTYNAKNAGTSELEGLVHVEGTARSWPSGTSVASYGTAYGWEEVRAIVNSLDDNVGDISAISNQLVREVV